MRLGQKSDFWIFRTFCSTLLPRHSSCQFDVNSLSSLKSSQKKRKKYIPLVTKLIDIGAIEFAINVEMEVKILLLKFNC